MEIEEASQIPFLPQGSTYQHKDPIEALRPFRLKCQIAKQKIHQQAYPCLPPSRVDAATEEVDLRKNSKLCWRWKVVVFSFSLLPNGRVKCDLPALSVQSCGMAVIYFCFQRRRF
jgi:hypothetical protein